MKKLLIVLLCAASLSAQGQRIYAGISGGNGWGMQKSVIDESVVGSFIIHSPESYQKDVPGSFGQGFRSGVFIGYRIDSLSFIEAGFSKINGASFTTTRTISKLNTGEEPYYTSKSSLESQSELFSFSYGMKFPVCKQFNLFAKVGILGSTVRINGSTRTENHGFFASSTFEYKYTYDFKSAFAVGGLGSIGVEYRVFDRFSIVGELFGQLLTTTIKSREITSYKEDGIDKLNSLPENERRYEYFNGKPSSIGTQADIAQKRQPLTVSQNAFGFNLGLRYQF